MEDADKEDEDKYEVEKHMSQPGHGGERMKLVLVDLPRMIEALAGKKVIMMQRQPDLTKRCGQRQGNSSHLGLDPVEGRARAGPRRDTE